MDRGIVNNKWLTLFPAITVTYLASARSNYYPLLMEMHMRQETGRRYFKFLNCLVENDTFMPLIHRDWNMNVNGSEMWIFHQKLKSITKALSLWSREQCGDIFQNPKEFEQKVKEAEEKWINTINPVDRINLQEIHAQYVRHIKTEEALLKQKTQLQWFKEGDANTRYFHSLIRGRRRRLYIHKVKDADGDWIQGDEDIGEAACNYFEDHFTKTEGVII
ncbi:uncharacterized protein [Nicotiana tomentosiformis]|uniref:uncharacterized protein n=1 Tax=Nicotiana tomentosiformis TaxID=4098 RepID=UPI00388C9901